MKLSTILDCTLGCKDESIAKEEQCSLYFSTTTNITDMKLKAWTANTIEPVNYSHITAGPIWVREMWKHQFTVAESVAADRWPTDKGHSKTLAQLHSPGCKKVLGSLLIFFCSLLAESPNFVHNDTPPATNFNTYQLQKSDRNNNKPLKLTPESIPMFGEAELFEVAGYHYLIPLMQFFYFGHFV